MSIIPESDVYRLIIRSKLLAAGQILVSSRIVAQVFQKRHDNVIRDIDDLLFQVSENMENIKIEVSHYEVEAGGGTRKQPEYLMTRDGFTLLAMGFTGSGAMEDVDIVNDSTLP